MAFTIKTIRTQVTLGVGSFKGGGNTLTIEGLPTDVTVDKVAPPDMPKATVKISGMKYDDMAQMTMLAFKPLQSAKNVVKIWAGEKGTTLAMIFSGEITSAYADFNSAPEVTFQIEAMSGSYPLQMAKPPMSVHGSTSAEKLFQQFAGQMGYTLKNQGITANVKNSVFNGSPMQKSRALADQLGIDMLIDDETVVIAPANAVRKTENVPLLRKDSGLIGYPTFTDQGISLKADFSPDFKLHGAIKVESIVPKATGEWRISKISHTLSAYQNNGGPWETAIEGTYEDV